MPTGLTQLPAWGLQPGGMQYVSPAHESCAQPLVPPQYFGWTFHPTVQADGDGAMQW